MENYVVVQGWMTRLGLTPSELLAFALIWGFTQDGRHTCHASSRYVASFCCLAESSSARRLLKRLEAKGVVAVTRHEGGVSEYTVAPAVCQNNTGGCVETTQGGASEQHGGCVETTQPIDNISISNFDNVGSAPGGADCDAPASGKKRRKGQVPPSLEEVREYAAKHGASESLATDFWLHYEGVGWESGKTSIKAWYPIFLKWVKNSGEGR